MPRKLPWLKEKAASTARPKRPALPAISTTKGEKGRKRVLDSDDESAASSSQDGLLRRSRLGLNEGQLASSSPPPEPYEEIFMEEGMDEDDKYRMVEDEFLSIAQKFTVHLHAAEYKRQQNIAISQNSETIHSISRPVTGKMPDLTRRKIEAVARAKNQVAVLEALVRKKTARQDVSDSDDDDLPYVGTTLHGLMDSPRRKSKSLSRLNTATNTRAAAGYKNSGPGSKRNQVTNLGSPSSRFLDQSSRKSNVKKEIDTGGSDDDVDLVAAAPVPAPKLYASTHRDVVHKQTEVKLVRKEGSSHNSLDSKPDIPRQKISGLKEKTTEKMTAQDTIYIVSESIVSESRTRRSRLERARALKAKEEKNKTETKEMDIPIFF